ncbi:ribosomal-protein-alanine N-acetyltransferase [Asanoa ferruginea]|uniref:Ribosomal-protein-alanine N-acetyltransferase n=1 Tax=Asanoa ferruginea TaxID=53367 RepID=A0A3D9ZXS7_9ACTN|nr:GNAT family N-acetyltransferase [Asanoa ferruginea]REG01997.1 ribosomal-protein-alanine N-acetyltransferase [Asanoa ferruginea]GIF49892.1 N-acetyltransferase [Asanoa ferruginea]
MPELQRLDAGHATALLRFERENRAYFARFISDRGDDYFAEFDARHATLLAEQAAGEHHLHVLVDEAGDVLGRFNLFDVADGTAELGFRLAEHATGRGVATAAVGQVCELARDSYGLHRLTAVAALTNAGSLGVLRRNDFTPTGEVHMHGKPCLRHIRDLVSPAAAVA